jgi:Sulfotransferase family
MAVHFIHVGKSGGTALRHGVLAVRELRGGDTLESPWGEVYAHRGHRRRLSDTPEGDVVVFSLRDPITRFVSGFYSRLNKGAPRHFREWSEEERQSFEWFQTPVELADALAVPRGELHDRAAFAMRNIRQLKRRLTHWTGKPNYFRQNTDKVLYIARQETLDEDWEKLKELLGFPPEIMLPRDDIAAHRTSYPRDVAISERGRLALRQWYSEDFKVLLIAEDLRKGRRPSKLRKGRRPSKLRSLASSARARLP